MTSDLDEVKDETRKALARQRDDRKRGKPLLMIDYLDLIPSSERQEQEMPREASE